MPLNQNTESLIHERHNFRLFHIHYGQIMSSFVNWRLLYVTFYAIRFESSFLNASHMNAGLDWVCFIALFSR
jgi:hypothetical protein